jgi:nucleoside-diphosphate-sugar epimerase
MSSRQGQSRRILVTGAGGRIGSMLVPALTLAGYQVTALDRAPPPAAEAGVRNVTGDITDPALMTSLARDQDALVHLAGHPTALDWDDIYAPNIIGAATVIEAAAAAGISRLILASSIHIAGHTPAHARFDAALPIRPDSPYGVSKAFAEAALRYAHERYDCAAYALRIGTCRARPLTTRERTTWLSPADFNRLIEACLTHMGGGYHTIWGFSNNRALDIDRAAWDTIGYFPREDADTFLDSLECNDVGTPGEGLIGGRFVRDGV